MDEAEKKEYMRKTNLKITQFTFLMFSQFWWPINMKKAHLSVHFQKLLYQLYLSWPILVVRVPVSHCKRTYPIRYLEDFTVLILD